MCGDEIPSRLVKEKHTPNERVTNKRNFDIVRGSRSPSI